MNRRVFVKRGGVALVALGLPPEPLLRSLLEAQLPSAGRKALVCIFQRGAVDGLGMVVPFGESEYYRLRRGTAIPAPSRAGGRDTAIDLDGFFGLHPSLGPLHELYRRGELAVVHATGSPDVTRSHFDAQAFMESATPGVKSTPDGWLNRVLQRTEGCRRGRTLADGALHAADHALGQNVLASPAALRGVSLTAGIPRSLQGAHPALAIPELARFGVPEAAQDVFTRLYRTEQGDAVNAAAGEAFDALEILARLDPAAYRPEGGAEYPAGAFGRSMRQIAQLLKADVGVEIAFAELGGWDTHVAQGGSQGRLALNLGQLAHGLRAFSDDLGDRMGDVVVLTMSEFGRTVAENGSGGTDHGHANCMLALGGPVAGGRTVGEWPGLGREQLHEGRDLALTTDFRDVLAEVVEGHLGATEVDAIFPGFVLDRSRRRGVIR